VYFVDEALDRPQTTALLSVADAYASLHRSEGFGLTLAEAMALGKPVVATGYSGNLDFMRPSNSFLVDYELVRLDRDHGSYPKGATWADPDVEQAAALLRLVADRSETVRERAAAGRQDVLKELHPRVAGRLISERLLEIDGRRREQRSAARIPAEADRPPLYATLVHRVRETVARVVPPRSDVAVVTRGDDQLLLLGDRRCSHFPRTAEGVYAGHYPADDDDAIAQLEEARASGDEYIVFPATARWWLDHYARLREHLDDHYLKVADDDSCVVYRLASVPANGAQPARPTGDADYPALVQALHERIRQTIPEGAAVAVVSKGDDDLVDLDGLRAWHFPTDGSGAWAGHYPADGRAAVGELEAVREQGVRYLAIPKSAFWWLGYYSDFAEHLRDRYDLVLTSADCLIYDLSPRSDLKGRRVLPRLFARRSTGS
jgi:hypothetical protein